MPRKRKAARAFRAPQTSVHADVQRRFGDRWAWFPDPVDFFRVLPTAAERSAYRELFPAAFYGMFEFEADASDQYPNSAVTKAGCCVFRRADFLAFLEEHPPTKSFEPPDLREVPYRDQQVVMARARRIWWRENSWPVNAAEAEWILFDGPRHAHEAKKEPLVMPKVPA